MFVVGDLSPKRLEFVVCSRRFIAQAFVVFRRRQMSKINLGLRILDMNYLIFNSVSCSITFKVSRLTVVTFLSNSSM